VSDAREILHSGDHKVQGGQVSDARVLITGDIHGDWGQLNKLLHKHGPDVCICTGDFGWWPKFNGKSFVHGQPPWSNGGIKPQGSQVYWCDGNHEDHEDLDSLGRGQKESIVCYEGVIYKPRGTTLVLPDGRIVLFVGGAASIDKGMRTPGFDWFDREVPNQHEYDRAMSYDRVDIVISHTCPTEVNPGGQLAKCMDPTRMMLQDILEKYRPSQWFFGHWHKYHKSVSGDTEFIGLDYPGHSSRWWRWLSQNVC
jgi:DNA repair exonuclease SbcCD nuclease subunit